MYGSKYGFIGKNHFLRGTRNQPTEASVVIQSVGRLVMVLSAN